MSTPRALAAPLCLVLLAACDVGQTPLPIQAVTNPEASIEYNQRQSDTELFVKTNHEALVRDLRAGGGPTLAEALRTAGVPPEDRETRAIQLSREAETYARSPGALISALMVYAR